MLDIDWLDISTRQYAALYGKPARRRKGAGGDRKLRRARRAAHQAFDKIWRRGHLSRSDAYLWLAVRMSMPRDEAHMGVLNAAECRDVVRLSQAYLAGLDAEQRPE